MQARLANVAVINVITTRQARGGGERRESRVCRPLWPYSRHVLAAILQFPVDCLAAYLHLAHGGGVGNGFS